MKQRPQAVTGRAANAGLNALSRAFASLTTSEDVRAFLDDLCTPAELEAMSDRWKVVPLVLQGIPYRKIHDRSLSVSLPLAV